MIENNELDPHTVTSFNDDMSGLNNMLMEMGGLARKQLQRAIKAMRHEDLELANEVLQRESTLNELELRIDSEVARILAKRQPVAQDLRIVMSVSKSVIDFERIGDEARKLANLALKFYDGTYPPPQSSMLRDVYTMSKLTQELLNDVLDCMVSGDADEALIIARSESDLQNTFSDALRRISTFMLEDSRNIGVAIDVIFGLKALERIGDHAINIAEYVVYALKGEDIRHLDVDAAHAAINSSQS